MDQLSGLDASFLHQESGTSSGHVSFLALYDGPSFGPDGPYAAIRALLEQRLDRVPRMRQRLVEIPFDLDLPYWVDDPDFDLDFHLRHVAVPPPGDRGQLAALAGRLIGRRLDRSRPLWELNVIESIEDDEIAILLKTHHAAVEGATGRELLGVLLDTSPDFDPEAAIAEPLGGEPIPDSVELLRRSYTAMATSPQRLVRAQQNALRSVGELFLGFGRTFDVSPFAELRSAIGLADAERAGVRVPPAPSPRAPFNAPTTAHRRIAWRSVPLREIKAVKHSAETTFHDVVVAVCAGGLRRYLLRHDALPAASLVALVPIAVRRENAAAPLASRVSAAVVKIATHEDDPARRLAEVHDALANAHEHQQAIPAAEVIERFEEFSTPAVAAQASRMVASVRVADREHPPFNLAITNVAGPRDPLYTAGGRLKALLPALPVSDGMGLNMNVVSYSDRLDFCLVACRELVPDLEALAEDLVKELEALAARPKSPRKRRPGRLRQSRPLAT